MSPAETPSRFRPLASLAALCVALAALLAAAATFATDRLTAPAPAVIGGPPVEIGARPVAIPSASGALLRGWWIAGRPGAGAVVLMHGVRSNRLSLVARARRLGGHGYAVLLFDFQAHGESPGDRITFGARESMDAAAAVGFVRSEAPGERIGAVGLSLGGAATLLGARPLAVDALVLEAVYPDIGAAVANRLGAYLGNGGGAVAAALLGPFWRVALPVLTGVEAAELRPIDRIGSLTAPVLVISGERDDRTPIDEARAMFARAPEPKGFLEIRGAGHVDLERFDPPAYWRVVLPFLDANLRGGGTLLTPRTSRAPRG